MSRHHVSTPGPILPYSPQSHMLKKTRMQETWFHLLPAARGRLAQLARASRLHREGHRFESCIAQSCQPCSPLPSTPWQVLLRREQLEFE